MSQYGLEYDRRLLTTLGVANSRLYELRLQASAGSPALGASGTLRAVQDSFRVFDVEA